MRVKFFALALVFAFVSSVLASSNANKSSLALLARKAARGDSAESAEAIAALRAEGLVVTRQGVGAFVSAAPQQAPFRIDTERLQNLEEILYVMELRLCVEMESAGLAAERATRAQVRTSSTGCTGFTRKSDTRICISRRATSASKLCVTTTTGGHAPMRAVRRSSACISFSLAASRSMI